MMKIIFCNSSHYHRIKHPLILLQINGIAFLHIQQPRHFLRNQHVVVIQNIRLPALPAAQVDEPVHLLQVFRNK